MPNNDNSQSIRLCESLKKNIGEPAAKECAEKLPLSKSADYLRKFKWAKDVCTYLDSTYSQADILKIRMACSCIPPESKMAKIKRLYDEAAGLDEFAAKFNLEYEGENRLWHNGNELYFSYPACFCSCVKRVNETLPKTWCLCTLGYTKKLFDFVLGFETNVELLESVKLGNSRCVMKITKL